MSGECIWCAILGFVVLPFLGLLLLVLPLSLIARHRNVRLALRLLWLLCVAALLLLSLAVALRFGSFLALSSAAFLYLIALATSVVFHVRAKRTAFECHPPP